MQILENKVDSLKENPKLLDDPTYIQQAKRIYLEFSGLHEDDLKEDDEKLLTDFFKKMNEEQEISQKLFTKIEDSELKLIPDATEESLFLGTVLFEGEEIPVLNQNAFEVLVRKDCGKL